MEKVILEFDSIEEAAANLADPNLCKTDNWIAGAKWQAERGYSEEEVLDLLYKRDLYLLNRDEEVELELPDEWFEQFKKK
jgi:hypothetical protein